ncbi:MAG TPA: hypothetical protein DET40_00780 [Lentisphaeria bacterium]|nr:MAG: hypothetical protein A2X45_06390 [Lentisphaerae bacterium GWF2_50_93]HCE42067.1 hypothetical protein [Lentisphaeria bacterium]
MISNEIGRKLEDFWKNGIPEFVPRLDPVDIVPNMISSLIGSRRAGKSFRALQVADEFLRQRQVASIRNICFLDFDNPVLSSMNAKDLLDIQKSYLKLNPSFDMKTPSLFIFDEIYRIDGWENAVIELSRNRNWKVLVTGSSSKLLRDDAAKELRGKSIGTEIYPLSFREFLDFNRVHADVGSTVGQARLDSLLESYLLWGGFPALTETQESSKAKLLREYFDTMILRDVIQRFGVTQPRECIHLYRYLLSCMGKGVSHKSTYGYLRQCGFHIGRDTVLKLLQHSEDSWLFFPIPIYSSSQKEIDRNSKKNYCIDWALANHNSPVWDGSLSRAFENMVFVHLKRRHSRLNYYLTKSHRQEVDFIVTGNSGRPSSTIQVCIDISDKETLKREVDPLVSTAKYFGVKENFIVTRNEEQYFSSEGVKIRAVPAWKWLLE